MNKPIVTIPRVPKGKRITVSRTNGRGFYTRDIGENGAWIFECGEDVPTYLDEEARQGRVFLCPGIDTQFREQNAKVEAER